MVWMHSGTIYLHLHLHSLSIYLSISLYIYMRAWLINCDDNVYKSGGWLVWVHFLSSYLNLLVSPSGVQSMSTWSRYTFVYRQTESKRGRQTSMTQQSSLMQEARLWRNLSIYLRPILMWIVWFFEEYCLYYELIATTRHTADIAKP